MGGEFGAGTGPGIDWEAWARENVKRTYRRRALEGVAAALAGGANSLDAAAAGLKAAHEARLDHYARNSTVAGGIGIAIAVLLGGFSILFTVVAIYYAREGWSAPRNGRLARLGLVLGGLAIAIFIGRLAIRAATRAAA
jgi:mannose/fructose/N-acetylgalactosamine-specific phosphotransferase system component IIC